MRHQGFWCCGAQRRNRTADTGISAVNPVKSRGSGPLVDAKCTHPVYVEQSVDNLDRWSVLLCSSSYANAVPDSDVLVHLYCREGKSGSTERSWAPPQLERPDIFINPHCVDCTKSFLGRLTLDSFAPHSEGRI